jgi:uncharacterized membrane protein YdjX (TVP38/TMEM64 family)
MRKPGPRLKKLLLFGLIPAAVLLIAAWFYRDSVWQWLLEHEKQTREFVAVRSPLTALGIGFFVYFLLNFVAGLAGKSLVVGWLFGFWPALLIVNFGLTATALIQFWFTRYFLRESIESRFASYLKQINAAVERDGGFYLFSARVAHVPYTITNYLLGATKMRTFDFWWSTQLGMLPGNIAFVFAGSRVPTLQEIADHGVGHIFSPALIVAFVLIALFPWAARWFGRRFGRRYQEARPKSKVSAGA